MSTSSSMNPKETLDLSDCAREPIQIPGAIQPHGALLVIDEASGRILQAGGDMGLLNSLPGGCVGRSLQEAVGETLPQLQPAGPRESADRVLAQMQAASGRLSAADDLVSACNIVVREIRRTIGYDRVMIYQFLHDGTGAVIAEDRAGELPAFLNHRYPSTDIPAQARALYEVNPIRVIPDARYVPAPISPEISPVTGAPLDMSHCLLRSVSPVHLRYLENMGVGASMSVSLLVNGELWGLIACHNRTPSMVHYEALEICNHLGQLLASDIRVREEVKKGEVARTLQHARETVLLALDKAQDPLSHLLDPGPELEGVVRSHGMAVVAGDRVAVAGHAPTGAQALGLAHWLQERGCGTDGFAIECIADLHPDGLSFSSVASGLLALILPGDTPAVLMWFRPEQVEEINWAGSPHASAEPGEEPGSLNPRSSFAAWTEIVRNRSLPWEAIDLQSAQEFASRALSTLRRHQIARLNEELERANARLERLATLDGLTDIPNRRAFDERLETELARAKRVDGDLALILLDLDFFKEYNDFYGHGMGDDCLKAVADAIQSGIRAGDLAARIGGEEFAVFLSDATLEGASRAAELIRARIEALGLHHEKSPFGVVTASVGYSVAKATTLDGVDSLLAAADGALYQSKREGRNKISGAS